jgi:glutamate-1-semialdehyde aminotransferase
MEPVKNDFPEEGFLSEIRSMTKEKNIPLIFDEITSGFRICPGGSHLTLGINPDMAVFAKAMSNGYPMAAIIGTKEVMDAAEKTFISSSYWTERVGLCAAITTIEFYIKNNVHKHLIKIGEMVQSGWKDKAKEANIEIEVAGIYPLSRFAFKNDDKLILKTYFTQEMLEMGYLAGTALYSSFSHTEKIIKDYLNACGKVFAKIASLQEEGSDIEKYLKGQACHSGFQRLN